MTRIAPECGKADGEEANRGGRPIPIGKTSLDSTSPVGEQHGEIAEYNDTTHYRRVRLKRR
jgi:hypothetical protein